MTVHVFTDGGARGNPGPGAAGAVIYQGSKCRARLKRYLGHTTNNRAEYTAILMALEEAKKLGADRVEMCMDSELAVRQLNGQYRVKNFELAKIFLQIHNIKLQFKKVTFQHVPRAMNHEADAMVNEAIDENVLK